MLITIIGMRIPCQNQFQRCEKIENKKAKILVSLLITGLIVSLCISSGVSRAANIYVTKAGVPDPDGSADKPYHVVKSAIVRAKSLPDSTILIGPGKYYETVTIDTPCTLKNTGGPITVVTIGKMDYQASTTLDIITLNTHLFGDIFTFSNETWVDCARSNDICDQLKELGPNKPDVVAFQEIWDEDYFYDGEDSLSTIEEADPIIVRSGYCPSPGNDCLYAKHGDDEMNNPQNSACALMSKYALNDFRQVEWDEWEGFDEGMAAKGWVRATIVKDDFHIGIFNLHTNAYYDDDDFLRARMNQMEQLRHKIVDYRELHPDHAVFVMGDFNMYDHLSWTYNGLPYNEYDKTLIPWIGVSAGGKDADRNSPGFEYWCTEDCEHWTYRIENDLAWHFEKEDPSGRIDYIFYFSSCDGSVEVLPTNVEVLPFIGRNHCCTYCQVGGDVRFICNDYDPDNCLSPSCIRESSDHYSVHGKFKLIRK